MSLPKRELCGDATWVGELYLRSVALFWRRFVSTTGLSSTPGTCLRAYVPMCKISSSRIVMNGEVSDFFMHKRGLRQGDPLSPMLFIIVVDVLRRMIMATDSTIQLPISNRIHESIIAQQYADDTAIVAKADISTLISLKIMLRLFTKVSGLEINFSKSSFIPFNLTDDEKVMVSAVCGCQQSDFPINYLGMPLTIKKPVRSDYWPLLEKIGKRLEGWQARLISRGGRLQLVNTVLSSIPIYFMTSFMLPKWVLIKIDGMRRKFLWGKAEGQGVGIPLLNWHAVCLPKRYGGFGVADLELRNISLLLRWWWKPYRQPEGLWSVTAIQLRRLNAAPGPLIWTVNGSLFWRFLLKILNVFHWCVTWKIGDGKIISFWYDNWMGEPIRALQDGFPRPVIQSASLQQAFPLIPNIAPHMQLSRQIVFSNLMDTILWRWSSNGMYSANSVYKILISGGKIKWKFQFFWRCNAPLKVKIFAALVFRERILTHYVMARRGMQCKMQCYLCDSCEVEDASHLFYDCLYAQRVWRVMAAILGYRLMCMGDSMSQIWDRSHRNAMLAGVSEKEWAMRFACVLWFVWRQRNEIIFRGSQLPVEILCNRIKEEGDLWMRFCRGDCIEKF